MIRIGYKRWGEGLLFWVKMDDRDKIPAWRAWRKKDPIGQPMPLRKRMKEDQPVGTILLDPSGPFSSLTWNRLEAVALLLGVKKGFRFQHSNTK
jgi:hypothetical protein